MKRRREVESPKKKGAGKGIDHVMRERERERENLCVKERKGGEEGREQRRGEGPGVG